MTTLPRMRGRPGQQATRIPALERDAPGWALATPRERARSRSGVLQRTKAPERLRRKARSLRRNTPSDRRLILRYAVIIHTVRAKTHCMLSTYSYNTRPENICSARTSYGMPLPRAAMHEQSDMLQLAPPPTRATAAERPSSGMPVTRIHPARV